MNTEIMRSVRRNRSANKCRPDPGVKECDVVTEGILNRREQYVLPAPALESAPSIKSVARALRRNQAGAYRRACFCAFGRSLGRPVQTLQDWSSVALQPARRLFWHLFCAAAGGVMGGSRAASLAASRAAARADALSCEARAYRRSHPARRITLAVLLGLVITAVFCASMFSVGLEVYLGGQSIGYINSQREFESAVSSVSARVSGILQSPYLLHPDVSYRFSLVTRNALFDREEVEAQLFRQIKEVKHLYVLTVDGEIVGGTVSQAALQSTLDSLLGQYPVESHADSVGFVRDVQISRQLVAASWERTAEKMAEMLSAPVREGRTYTVMPGDTWDSIAAQFGMMGEALALQNQALWEDAPEDGRQLVISAPTPFLSIASVNRIFYNEPLAYESQTVENPDMYEGDTKLLVAGMDGEVQIMADVSYLDGMAVRQTEVGRVVLTPTVPEVTAVGTKVRPPKYPTGTFIQPYYGRLSSGFGYRTLFGTRGMHTGIDIGGSKGDAILASDGGTVIFAGTKNGYGKCVIVQHLKGLSTLYAHCSKLLVEKGQKVAQGETIALIGSTGRSTGPHLHFEVRLNDIPKNPRNYLTFS